MEGYVKTYSIASEENAGIIAETVQYPGLHQKRGGQQGNGGDFTPYSALVRLCGVMCTRMGCQHKKGMEELKRVQRRAAKMIKSYEHRLSNWTYLAWR